MASACHKNSHCHLLSKTPEIIYGKIRRAPGRSVERDTVMTDGGVNEWPSRSCLILCQTCCPHLHTDSQEIIAAKGGVCRQEGRSGRCLGPESSPASKGLEGPGKTLAPRSVSASEPPSLSCPFPLLLFGPESLSLPSGSRGGPGAALPPRGSGLHRRQA